MLNSVLNALFGCAHRRTTFPLTPGRHGAHSSAQGSPNPHGTYVVCLDCGKEFGYDWSEMRIGNPVLERVPASATESYSIANR